MVVTGLDRASFDEGLALIAAVQGGGGGHLDCVVVLDLGLGSGQEGRLALLRGVEVWPSERRGESLFGPGGDEVRLGALRYVWGRLGERVAALWIDPGVVPEGSLEGAFRALDEGGILWTSCVGSQGGDGAGPGMVERAAHQMERLRALMQPGRSPGGLGYVLGLGSAMPERWQCERGPHWRRQGYRSALGAIRWRRGSTRSEAIRDPVARVKTRVLGRFPVSVRPAAKALWRAVVPRELEGRWVERGRRWRRLMTSRSIGVRLEGGRPVLEVAPVSTFRHPVGPEAPLDGLRFGVRRQDALFVVGSGPSLRGVDMRRLEGLDSIGMNAAYRHWERIGWYPSYYACLDTMVLESHRLEIRELVRRRGECGIRLFFLREGILETYPELAEDPSVFLLDPVRRRFDLLTSEPITTGSFSALFGMMLGYRRIYLLGIDCNYVEQLPGAALRGEVVLEMVSQPRQNPNYFIDDYQQVGDRYHLPNPIPDLHLRAWEDVRRHQERLGCEIFQTSQSSRLQIFPQCDLTSALRRERPRGAGR